MESDIQANEGNRCNKHRGFDLNNTHRKRKMRAEIKRLKMKCSRLQKKGKKGNLEKRRIENVISELRELLPKAQFEFFATKLHLSLKKKKGFRWTIKDKNFALSIYYQSRKAYNILKKIFNLPSKSTLLRYLSKISISPGFNEQVLDTIKLKMSSMPIENKSVYLDF